MSSNRATSSSSPLSSLRSLAVDLVLVIGLGLGVGACGDIVPIADPNKGGGEQDTAQSDGGGADVSGETSGDGSDGDGSDGDGSGADGVDDVLEPVDTVGPSADLGADPTDLADTQGSAGPGSSCDGASDCASGFCVDGVCCYIACNAACVACTTSLTGLPEGSCGPVAANSDPNGTCPDDGASSCGRTGVCDGKSACKLYGTEAECAPPTCQEGVRTAAGTCDGAGACKPGAEESCGVYQCSGNVCADECASDDGCNADSWCSATLAVCLPKKATGEECKSGKGSQCTSGFCVDGRCCNAECDGVCSACSAALSGLQDGVCGPALPATDPDSECADLGATSCATDGFCDGVGACRLYASGATCLPSTCADGVQTNARVCDGNGACQSAGQTPCGAYACAGGVCAASCASDASCQGGAYCDVGSCIGSKEIGAACQSGDSCGTGACVDGFCCDHACGGPCEACNAALTGGADGICAPITTGSDPDGDCADQGSTTCGTTGACDGVGGCAFYDPSTKCLAGSCSGGVATPAGVCSGAGYCEVADQADCAPFTCDTEECKKGCDVASDCVAGSFCEDGVCTGQLPVGATCTSGGQCESGQCVDGVCCDSACEGTCQACSAAKKGNGADGECGAVLVGSDPDLECSDEGPAGCGDDGSCDGVGACRSYSAGTPCSPAVCTGGAAVAAGSCDGEGTCLDGQATPCAPFGCGQIVCNDVCGSAEQCASGNQCANGACVGLVSQGGVCTTDSQCQSAACVDGYCCNSACTGLCEACSTARKGSGPNGVCGAVGSGLDPDSECLETSVATCGTDGTCDGARACRRHVPGSACSAASCTAGAETLAGSCNGAGVCTSGATAQCTPYICGASACKTSCSGDSDCASGHWCSAGTCSPKLTGGALCTVANQCGSGFCVDGVCCDSACAGPCQACSLVLKGDGKNGICGNVVAATDPDSDCADQGAATCGNDGACNGAGACRKYAGGTACGAPSCASGSQTLAAACNGAGTCTTGATTPCAPFVCGATACKTTCTVDADCASGFCSGGQCSGKIGNGGACTKGTECASGSCVDSVCCNTACTGLCQGCSAAKKGAGADGACGPIEAAADPDNECPAQAVSTCGTDGACNGSGACRLYVAGSQCGAGQCDGTTQKAPASCNGVGACSQGASTSCSPYVCGPSVCKSSCAGDSDCISGHFCSGGACVPKFGNGAACSSASQCSSSSCVDSVCCNTSCAAACQACSAVRKGSGSDGTCGAIAAGTDPDSDCADQGAASCGTSGVCDGASSCQKYGPSTSCGAASCASGVQKAASTCNGSGTCTAGASSSCGLYLCGGTACRATCDVNSDCVDTAYCAGKECVAKKVLGQGCATAAQCGSGVCADSVCCESVCGGSCVACVGSKTGASDGKCAAIIPATDPDAECTDQGAASCGANGLCDGVGACQRYPSGTTCVGATCSSGTQTSVRTCNGLGTCSTGLTAACAPYLCGTSACATSCSADAQCTSGSYCSSPSCVTKKANGAACTGGNQCTSGSCTDGVCCNVACAGSCQACSAAKTGGTSGTCANVPGGADPDNECTDQGAATCGLDGSCSGAGACGRYAAGTVCSGASCVSGTQTAASTCNGSGTCNPGGTSACAPYNCGTSACVTTCSTNSDCVSGNYCTGGLCKPLLAQGAGCTSATQCTTGFCVDGVCCGSACTGKCQRCDSTYTFGEDGTCAVIDSDDPDNECSSTSLCCFGLCRTLLQCLQ